MLTKLKKCKTLKEIYEVLGRIFFGKIAMYIVMGWCLLPILSIFFHIRWMGMAEQTFMYRLKLSDGSFAYGCADIGISDSILYRHDTDTEQ